MSRWRFRFGFGDADACLMSQQIELPTYQFLSIMWNDRSEEEVLRTLVCLLTYAYAHYFFFSQHAHFDMISTRLLISLELTQNSIICEWLIVGFMIIKWIYGSDKLILISLLHPNKVICISYISVSRASFQFIVKFHFIRSIVRTVQIWTLFYLVFVPNRIAKVVIIFFRVIIPTQIVKRNEKKSWMKPTRRKIDFIIWSMNS